MELYKAVLMVAHSEQVQMDLRILKWQVASLEVRESSDGKVLYINNPYHRWIVRAKNIASIERLYGDVGDVIRLRLKGNRFILLYSSPSILMKVAEILSRETGLIISDVVSEKELLRKEGGVREHG
jgi:23S rRNA G2445 N2-methylase RlmL